MELRVTNKLDQKILQVDWCILISIGLSPSSGLDDFTLTFPAITDELIQQSSEYQTSITTKKLTTSLTDRLNGTETVNSSQYEKNVSHHTHNFYTHVLCPRVSLNTCWITESKSYQITCNCETMNFRQSENEKSCFLTSHSQQAKLARKNFGCGTAIMFR